MISGPWAFCDPMCYVLPPCLFIHSFILLDAFQRQICCASSNEFMSFCFGNFRSQLALARPGIQLYFIAIMDMLRLKTEAITYCRYVKRILRCPHSTSTVHTRIINLPNDCPKTALIWLASKHGGKRQWPTLAYLKASVGFFQTLVFMRNFSHEICRKKWQNDSPSTHAPLCPWWFLGRHYVREVSCVNLAKIDGLAKQS